MANRRANRPSIVEWDRMRKVWRRDNAAQYIGTFINKNRNYEFTVAQAYHGLYVLGVTCEQYDTVKSEMQKKSSRVLPDIFCTELLKGGDVRKKSFRNNQEQQVYIRTFVEANNRRLVKEKRDEVKVHYEKIDKMYKEPGEKTIVSFDLEVYEYNNDKVLEIGFIAVRLPSEMGTPVMTEKCHYIIEENLEYKNTDFVKDNRDGFRFGESQTVPLEKAMEEFRRAVQSCTFVVGHSAHNDENYLKGIGLDLSELKKEIADTQVIEQHKGFEVSSICGDRINLAGLSKLLQKYAVVYRDADLHNAASDAYYTMKVFLRQMGHASTIVNPL